MANQTGILRIGTGAGFSSDRLDPAIQLVAQGSLDVIVFECLGERTLAFAHRDMQSPNGMGYNPLLAKRMKHLLPLCSQHNTRLITNMGAADPLAAALRTSEIASLNRLEHLNIAAVLGDDVTHLITPDTELIEPECTVAEIGRPMIGANAYLGAQSITPALADGADIVITGRVADPSLFLAPIQAHFGWSNNDWQELASGTVAGHLMECAAQVTGGYFADPGFKEVEELARVGFPIAEISRDGSLVITKLPTAGGRVDSQTVKEQLYYEVHDPSAYITPDVIADFSMIELNDQGNNRVMVRGAKGRTRTETLKVTIAFDGGYLAEAEISYAGPGALRRAQLAGEIISQRLDTVHGGNKERRIDMIGAASLHASAGKFSQNSTDIRLRCALRTPDHEEAANVLWEMEALLCCGPAGGGGYRGHITPSVLTYSALLERDQVKTTVEFIPV